MALLHIAGALGEQEVLFWLMFGWIMYLLPMIVAVARSSDEQWRVLRVNLFSGWTIVGWFAALKIAVRS